MKKFSAKTITGSFVFFSKEHISLEFYSVERWNFANETHGNVENRYVTFWAPFQDVYCFFRRVNDPVKRHFVLKKNSFFLDAVVGRIRRQNLTHPVWSVCDGKSFWTFRNSGAFPARKVMGKKTGIAISNCNLSRQPPTTWLTGSTSLPIEVISKGLPHATLKITMIKCGCLSLPNLTFVKLKAGFEILCLKFLDGQRFEDFNGSHTVSNLRPEYHTQDKSVFSNFDWHCPRRLGLPDVGRGRRSGQGACASPSDLSVFGSLPGATPDPHPNRHCGGFSRVVLWHAPRQPLSGLLGHTVRHLRGPEPKARESGEPPKNTKRTSGPSAKIYGPEVKTCRPEKILKTSKIERKTYV